MVTTRPGTAVTQWKTAPVAATSHHPSSYLGIYNSINWANGSQYHYHLPFITVFISHLTFGNSRSQALEKGPREEKKCVSFLFFWG